MIQEIRLKRLHKKADKAINACAMNNSLINWQRLLLASKRYNKAYTRYQNRIRQVQSIYVYVDEINEITNEIKLSPYPKEIITVNHKDLPVRNRNELMSYITNK